MNRTTQRYSYYVIAFFLGIFVYRQFFSEAKETVIVIQVTEGSTKINGLQKSQAVSDSGVRVCKSDLLGARECIKEDEIFGEKGGSLAEDDPLILKYIRENIMVAPNLTAPYNLNGKTKDFEKYATQYQIVLTLLNGKRNGTFVEAGANDGEFISNTLMLEKNYGWTGLLVEPDTKAFAALRSKNRKSWIANVCLSPSKRMEKLTFLLQKDSTWSKIANVSDHHKEWNEEDVRETTIKCAPFFSLVSSLNMLEIDYFSLDIEGAELSVLETIPFDKVTIRTMSIEYDKIINDPGADAKLKRIMSDNDFVLVGKYTNGFAADYIFVHSSVAAGIANL